MKKKIIGSNYGLPYIQKKYIYEGIDNSKFLLKKYYDSQKLITSIENQIFKLSRTLITNNNRFYTTKFFRDNFSTAEVSMFHFYDTVSDTKKPWITHLERDFDIHIKKTFNPYNYLIRKECKQIIACCEWTKKIQLHKLQNSDFKTEIEKKIITIHPPQKIFVDKPKDLDKNKITFIMIGNTFFNKGGVETLKIFNRLNKLGYHFHLNIVSNLSPLRWPIGEVDRSLYNKTVNEIKTKKYISHYSGISKQKLTEILKLSDVGILMSTLENYGLSSLEYKAYGMPCVMTTQRVFLETNNDEIGWMVKVDTDKFDVINLSSKKHRKNASDQIYYNGLKVFRNILENPSEIYKKGKLSIKYLRENHDPIDYVNKMTSIYAKYA